MVVKIDSKNVSWERVDDEVIAIQLETGRYYNLHNTSAEIWSLLANGAEVDMLVKGFSKIFPDVISLSDDIEIFIHECFKAKLLVLDGDIRLDSSDFQLPEKLESWVTPALVEYSDLQDLILVDPIHDVKESGWPDSNE